MATRSLTRVLVGLFAVGGLALAGCTTDPQEPEPTTPGPTADPDSEDGTAASRAVVRDVHLAGTDLQLAVGPVAVADGIGVLRVEGLPTERTDQVDLGLVLYSPFVGAHPSGNAIRLLDLERGEIRDVARLGTQAVAERGVFRVQAGSDDAVLHVAFAAPESSSVDVLVPRAGLFTDVPVVAAEDTDLPTATDLVDGPLTDLTLPVTGLDTYTEHVDGAVRARSTGEELTVQVAADVLFAFDSADLGPDADSALAAAVAELAGYPAGQLAIVGHTDDQGEPEYNRDLSLRRAEAVEQRIGRLVDLTAFDVTVEGKGADEPAVEGTTEDARAFNRRVELRFVPPAAAREPGRGALAEPTGELAASPGPTAPGADGVLVEDVHGHRYEVVLPEVRRRHNHLVGEVELRNAGDEEVALVSILASAGWNARGELDPQLQTAASKLTVARGGLRAFPLDYEREEGRRTPVADLLLGPIGAGDTSTVTVVWPDVGGDTVVVDSPQMTKDLGRHALDVGGAPFRLTEVRVVED